MKKSKFLTILLSMLALSIGYARAESALLDELMIKSGIMKQLEGFPELLQMGFRDATQGADETKQADISRIQEKMNQAYNIDDFKATLRQVMGENLTDDDITEVLKWLNSPRGQKITQIEEEHSTVEAEQAKQAFMMNFDSASVAPERMAMIQELDEAVYATDMLLTIILNSQKAIMLAVMPYVPTEQRIPLKEIDTQVEMNRPILQSQYKEYVLLSMLYVYQELSDEELKGYVDFARSPAGAKYHKVTTNAFNQAFTQAATSLGAQIGSTIPTESPVQN